MSVDEERENDGEPRPEDERPPGEREPGDEPGDEPDDEPDDAPDDEVESAPPTPRRPDPLPLEEEVVVEVRRRPAEPCPNCGAPLPEDGIVCLRCGYDLKSLKVVDTETGADATDDEDEEEVEAAAPMSPDGRGGLQVPVVVAAIGLVTLVGGYLAGVGGLFPTLVPEDGLLPPNPWTLRMSELGRTLSQVVFWSAGGIAALAMMAVISARPLGDLRIAAARMLAIVILLRQLTFIDLASPPIERIVEFALQYTCFLLLLLVVYGLRRHDALMTSVLTLVCVVGIWLLGVLVQIVGVA